MLFVFILLPNFSARADSLSCTAGDFWSIVKDKSNETVVSNHHDTWPEYHCFWKESSFVYCSRAGQGEKDAVRCTQDPDRAIDALLSRGESAIKASEVVLKLKELRAQAKK